MYALTPADQPAEITIGIASSTVRVSSPKGGSEEPAPPWQPKPASMRLTDHTTHEVLNQPPPFEDVNLFDADTALQEGLVREGAEWAIDRVRDTGAVAGSAEAQEHGRRAERNTPRLEAETLLCTNDVGNPSGPKRSAFQAS